MTFTVEFELNTREMEALEELLPKWQSYKGDKEK